MATAPKTDAEKITKLREMAKDKSLPQEVRNTYLDQAVKMEEKAAKGAGVKLAKGGSVKKMMYGGMADKPMMAKGGDAKKKMMMGGAVAKELPMRGQRTATNMAKGGAAMKAKKK